jgi:hypothetical protein
MALTTRMRVVAASLILALPIASAVAQSDDQVTAYALGEVAGELEICSAYFGVASRCIKPQKPNVAAIYENASNRLAELAIASGKPAGISDEAFLAQYRMYLQAMTKAMGKCTNIAVLLERYLDFCQKIAQDADPRLHAWTACIRAGQDKCGGPGLP